MATQQLFLVADSSSLANFKAWAKPISDWFRSCGYTNTSDSGQLNGAGGGVGGSAGWSALAATPGSGATFYEIFQSGASGLTTFYVKVEYGNCGGSGTNNPSIAITLGTGTNGSGTLNGFVTNRMITNTQGFNPASSVTTYECDFSGDTTGGSYTDRIGAMYWRNYAGTSNSPMCFAIERSINSSGSYTSAYVTIYVFGYAGGSFNAPSNSQQSLLFGVGACLPWLGTSQTTSPTGGIGPDSEGKPVRGYWRSNAGNSSAFNGSLGFDTAAPYIGYFDLPGTMIASLNASDFAEGVTFSTTVYGASHTYMPTKNNVRAWTSNNNSTMFAMRYD